MADNAASNGNGGRVSTSDFYKALMDMREEMGAMERRILDELKPLPALIERIDNVRKCAEEAQKTADDAKQGVNDLRAESRRFDAMVGVISLVLSAIAGWFGAKP